MTTILAVVSDTHINSTVGLSVPMCNLDDGGTYHASKAQRWLWHNWLDFWETVTDCVTKHTKGKDKPNVWTVFNGDLIEGDGKNRSHQLVTHNDTTAMRVALDTIEPALKISSRTFVIRGTAAHVGLSANLEEKIAIDIGAERCKDTDAYSWWKLLLDCEEVLFDITHHGNVGRLPWTKPNPLNALAVRLILSYTNQRLPQVALRSHRHLYAETGSNYPIRVIALPAWQLATEYTHRLAIVEPADVGGLVFICHQGEYELIVKRYQPEKSKTWKETK